MKEVRFFYVPDALTANELPSDEAMHALRVLRMKIGDELLLMDGQGNYYRAEVTLAHTKHCFYEVKEQMPQERQWLRHIHLAIAPTKMMDRIEWMTEKAVEIGLDELSFLNCQFSERRLVKIPRLEKIMISAVKQSHNGCPYPNRTRQARQVRRWKNENIIFANFVIDGGCLKV